MRVTALRLEFSGEELRLPVPWLGAGEIASSLGIYGFCNGKWNGKGL